MLLLKPKMRAMKNLYLALSISCLGRKTLSTRQVMTTNFTGRWCRALEAFTLIEVDDSQEDVTETGDVNLENAPQPQT